MERVRSLPKQWPTVACVALVVVAYARAPFGGFVWDDVHLILRDARLQSWSSFVEVVSSSFWSGSPLTINEFYAAVYRPVVSAAYLVEMQLFGANAVGFHIVNIVLHIVCTVLCIRWITRRIPSAPPLALFFGGMLFAVHPSRVETIAWVSGCVDVWMVFWLLLGLEAWHGRRSVLAGVLFALALFSKEVAVVVPLLLLTDHFLLRRSTRIWQPWSISTGIITAALALRIWLVPIAATGRPGWAEMPVRVLSTLGYFVQRVALPWPQTVHPAARSYDAASNEIFAPWAIGLGVAALSCVAVLAFLAWRHREKYRPWLADALWFFIPLLPTLNILDIDAVARASDRFLYWPLMGVCALIARAITLALLYDVSTRRAVMGLAAGVSVLFVLASAIHVSHFRTDYTLWAHEYEVDQSNTEALWALAGMAKYEGLSDSAHQLCTEGFQAADHKRYQWTAIRFALCQLETSLDLAIPDDPETVVYVRGVYDQFMEKSLLSADRGTLRFDMHITSETIRDRLMADPNNVALPRARAHLVSGDTDEAIVQLEQITRSYPVAKAGWGMLIAAYQRKGDVDRATATASHAKRLFGEELDR
ncbi:MAG: hypothetical protein O7F08_14165 [Deltaproteobacteria bacterium]|nr:hypothetical protein [Deltaproteobacteria bacterium]